MREDPIAAHARRVALAENLAAALACIARLERDVNEARAEALDQRRRLARIAREARRAVGASREPFSQLVLGSLAIIAEME